MIAPSNDPTDPPSSDNRVPLLLRLAIDELLDVAGATDLRAELLRLRVHRRRGRRDGRSSVVRRLQRAAVEMRKLAARLEVDGPPTSGGPRSTVPTVPTQTTWSRAVVHRLP